MMKEREVPELHTLVFWSVVRVQVSVKRLEAILIVTDTTALIRLLYIYMILVLCSQKLIQIKTEMYSVYIVKVKSTRP